LATVYCFSSLGAVAGGWISGALIRRGLNAISARKWVLAGASVLALLLVLGTHLHTIRSVVILFSVLTAAHQAWAANLFTVNSDLIPRSSLSTSVGIAGAAGALGGVSFQKFTGLVLMHTHGDYTLVFLLAAFAYPVSLLIFHLLTRAPDLQSAAPAMTQ
jgi:ACS family hexuronate transporter-like MFS transporter